MDNPVRPKSSLAEDIHRILTSFADESRAYVLERGFYISMIGYQCDRQIQLRMRPYTYLGPELVGRGKQIYKDMNTGLTAAKIGESIHEYYAKSLGPELLCSEGAAAYSDSSISLRGRYDLIIDMGGEKVLVDLKTTTRYAKKYLPKNEHINQVMLYLGATGIRQGAVHYIFRDSAETFTFPVSFDPGVFETLLNRFRRIQDAEDRRVLLPMIHNPRNKFPCSYCEWAFYCHPCNECAIHGFCLSGDGCGCPHDCRITPVTRKEVTTK